VCIVVCDGLKGLPDAITTTSELAQVQTCVIHPIRNTFRYASRKDWDVAEEFLREGACAHMHLQPGRMCTLRHGHRGSCEFVPRDSVSIPLVHRQAEMG
jgi:hypothetical protein